MSKMSKHVLLSEDKYNRLINSYKDDKSESSNEQPQTTVVDMHTISPPSSESPSNPGSNVSTIEIHSTPHSVSSILHSLPKSFKSRGESILQFLPPNSWNDTGEFIYQGQPIKGSHISDLIRDVIKSRTFKPIGYQQFYETLASLNIPEGLIGTSNRREMFRKYRLNSLKTIKPKKKKIKAVKWLTY
jgi:hypothetical protein